MKKRLIQNLSVNAVQLIINQVLGLGIFYVLSAGLDKTSFGEINLVLAILLAAFNILSFGIDQLVIKKIAAGADASTIISIYLLHVIIAGLFFYGVLFAGNALFPHIKSIYPLLLLIGIGKLMIFFSTPFKQAANGMERFRLLAYMSVVSNVIRCGGLIVFASVSRLNLHNIVIVFIAGDVIELLFCVALFKSATGVKLNFKWPCKAYRQLLGEALPQTGVVLITSALARFDWIFIGFILSAVKLAEYSFAYKIFEISTLPLLAVAPLLIPRFTKMLQQVGVNIKELELLIRAEMMVAALVILFLNIYWSPVIDAITAGKYGAINVKTIFLLSLCTPFLYLNNFLWTIYFARGQLKMILTSFVITFAVNVVGDVVLIPFFKNEGAAFAFLVACIVQTIYYLKQNNIISIKSIWQPLFFCSASALTSGFAAKVIFPGNWLIVPTALSFYVVLLFVTKQVRLSDRGIFV